MTAYRDHLEALRRRHKQIGPDDAHGLQQLGAIIVDIREEDELAGGTPAGAIRISRGFLELRVEQHVPNLETPIMLLCGSGVRSLFACEALGALGYADVRSVSGGFAAWSEAGLPIDRPSTPDPGFSERYRRHLIIPEIGEAGQHKLANARVLMVGAGGLGCPSAIYLAAAGVGTIGIVDDDVIERSNLQRQILHADWKVGLPKAYSARDALKQLNPSIAVEPIRERLTGDNLDRIVSDYDVIVDGSDNFATRYLVNRACVERGVPTIYGSVQRFEGQVSVFWPGHTDKSPCYCCLYPEPPPAEIAPSCAQAGVLGVLPGVIGTLQATETLKILLDIGKPLIGRLLVFDALRAKFAVFDYARRPDCRACGDAPIRAK